jgi:hypothetical protein
MLHLSQFHLKLTLVATGTLSKNLEDQADSLHNLDAPNLLEITLLYRRQGMIKQYVVNLLCLEAIANLGDLSAPNKRSWIGTYSMDRDSPADCNSCRTRQCSKFVEGTLITSNAPDPDAN